MKLRDVKGWPPVGWSGNVPAPTSHYGVKIVGAQVTQSSKVDAVPHVTVTGSYKGSPCFSAISGHPLDMLESIAATVRSLAGRDMEAVGDEELQES
jgi:hypothetical protein